MTSGTKTALHPKSKNRPTKYAWRVWGIRSCTSIPNSVAIVELTGLTIDKPQLYPDLLAEFIDIEDPYWFDDSISACFGTGIDAFFNHNGSHFNFFNDIGDVTFTNRTDDGDIIFASDNGSGGTATYLTLDGSAVETVFSKATRHSDSVSAYFGAGNDLELQQDGGDSYITIRNHDLKIQQTGDDKSIIFYSDDGSGGVAEYFRVDGANSSGSSKFTSWPDNSKVSVGTGLDAQFYHSGSHTYIENSTGDLQIIQNTDDGDIIFANDNMSGGTKNYFILDCGDGNTWFEVD